MNKIELINHNNKINHGLKEVVKNKIGHLK